MIPPHNDSLYARARVALGPLHIAGSTPEPAFDVFVHLVCAALDVPAALLGFFDGEMLCIKAAAGALQREAGAGALLRNVFERRTPIVESGDAHFFCAAPVFAPDGQAVGVIAAFDDCAHTIAPGTGTTLEAIALAVTHALEARKLATTEAALPRALFAFDAADMSVLFADAETVRQRNATPRSLQSLSFNDIFSGVDEQVRHDLDVMRETMSDEPLTFFARTLGPIGFWFPVTCSARAVRAPKRAVIVIEYAQPVPASERPNLHSPARQSVQRPRWQGHSIEAVLSKIEAGRRALRAERGEIDQPLTAAAFDSAATQLLADNGDPHVLAVFAVGDGAISGTIERARRVRLLCDHDLVAVLDDIYIAMLLRDMPVSIGRRAIERFARSLSNARYSVRATGAGNAGVRALLDDAIAGLRVTD